MSIFGLFDTNADSLQKEINDHDVRKMDRQFDFVCWLNSDILMGESKSSDRFLCKLLTLAALYNSVLFTGLVFCFTMADFLCPRHWFLKDIYVIPNYIEKLEIEYDPLWAFASLSLSNGLYCLMDCCVFMNRI